MLWLFSGGYQGSLPAGKLTLDPSGDGVLYGAAGAIVFALAPPGVNGGTASNWSLSALQDLNGFDPEGPLVFGQSSPPELFGTTYLGDVLNRGMVIELLPRGPNSYWSWHRVHVFRGIPGFRGMPHDGQGPVGGLIVGSNGALYGTTAFGGYGPPSSLLGLGTAFEMQPPSLSASGRWQEVQLHRFTGRGEDDGAGPQSGLLLDLGTGKLYGTTTGGGAVTGCGTVYELAHSGSPTAWTETVLASFKGPPDDGCGPEADLNFGTDGNLYGTTSGGGVYNHGTVFEVTLP